MEKGTPPTRDGGGVTFGERRKGAHPLEKGKKFKLIQFSSSGKEPERKRLDRQRGRQQDMREHPAGMGRRRTKMRRGQPTTRDEVYFRFPPLPLGKTQERPSFGKERPPTNESGTNGERRTSNAGKETEKRKDNFC